MPEHTPITTDEIDRILAEADLGESRGFALLSGGYANTSYRVDRVNDHPLVLTVINEKTDTEARPIFDLQALLYQNGSVPVTQPKAVVRFVRAHGASASLAVVKAFADGVVPARFSPEQHFALGEAVSQLHEVAPPRGLPREFAYGPPSWAVTASWDRAAHGEFAGWLAPWSARWAALGDAVTGPATHVLTHGDIFPDNTVWDPTRPHSLRAILDWEEACVMPRVWDLGMILCGSHEAEEAWRDDLATTLVLGYGRERLSPAEVDALPAVAGVAAAATAFWHYRQHRFIRPDPRMMAAHLRLVRIADRIQRTAL